MLNVNVDIYLHDIDMNEMIYGNYMHIDIIVHDALVICMSRIVHVVFIVHVTIYNMQ